MTTSALLVFKVAMAQILLKVQKLQAFVDGTPGANDMPGRLTFSTTADGASSPTERMRINSGGTVGLNVNGTAPIDSAVLL
jgi:hypothetical protein